LSKRTATQTLYFWKYWSSLFILSNCCFCVEVRFVLI